MCHHFLQSIRHLSSTGSEIYVGRSNGKLLRFALQVSIDLS
jgi:hypothetical protein